MISLKNNVKKSTYEKKGFINDDSIDNDVKIIEKIIIFILIFISTFNFLFENIKINNPINVIVSIKKSPNDKI